jgi:intracellular multiplication protein IcmL
MPNNAGMKNQSAAISRKLSDPAFTQRLLRRSFLTHVLQGVTSIAVVGDLLWRDAHPPQSHYFYTDGTGTPREVFPLDAPVMSDTQVVNWTVNSVVAAYSVDFQHYRQQLSDASQHFTVAAWRSFGTSYIQSGNLQKMKEARLSVLAVPQAAGVILHKAVVGDRLTWQIQFPMLVSPENENAVYPQRLMVTVLVGRTTETDHPDGIAIEQLNAPPAS